MAAFAKRRATARQRYTAFVLDGMHGESIWTDLKAQAYLGDDDFVARSLKHADAQDDVNTEGAAKGAAATSG